MCDSADANWAWTVRKRSTGEPVRSADGYAYFFAEEDQARDLMDRLDSPDLETVLVRDPGA